MSYKIAIDGPSSAGKSTVAKAIAKELGYVYIDTGAMYRAIALYLLENNIDYNNEIEIEKHLNNINIDLKFENNTLNLYLNNKNITEKIRTEEVSNAASISSQFYCVREKLLVLQRELAKKNSCVMDGRDIASRVLPDANIKIFLTASLEERAKRRYNEYIEKGIETTLEKTKEEIENRDFRDINRKNDPLKKVDDAIEIDTSKMNIDQVIDKILAIITGECK